MDGMYPRVLWVTVALLLPMLATAQNPPAPAATQPMQLTDVPATARAISTVAILGTLRSVTELYTLQHGDRPLALADLADWTILLRQTDKAGSVNPPAGTKPLFGPYLPRPPVNALTGHSKLCEIGHVTPDAGWIWDSRGKRPLIVIALPRQSNSVTDYLIACNVAIRCPEVSAERQPASIGRAAGVGIVAGTEPALVASLNAKLRLQIALAHLALAIPQRRSFFPTLDQMRDWHILLASPGEGATTPGKPIRPSLPGPLGNPLRDNAVRVVAAGAAQGHPDAGWTYSPTTGQLRVVVPAGFIPNGILGPEDIEPLQPEPAR